MVPKNEQSKKDRMREVYTQKIAKGSLIKRAYWRYARQKEIGSLALISHTYNRRNAGFEAIIFGAERKTVEEYKGLDEKKERHTG